MESKTDHSYDYDLFRVDYENVIRLLYSPDDFYIAVDGFGLVLEILLNQHFNWTTTFNTSGVFLHVIYCIERTLGMLLKLKQNLKLVFFRQVDCLLDSFNHARESNDLALVFHHVVLHLKTLKAFKNRLLFFKNFGDYITFMKSERIVCYMGFSYADAKLINNDQLAILIDRHFVNAIQANLDLGISVILTKNFW